MRKPMKILFATDFSPGAKIALKMINKLDKKFKTTVSIVHVVESFWENWVTSGLCQNEMKDRLKAWISKFTSKNSVTNTFVKVGNPAENIIRLAKARKSDLIVMGGKSKETSGRYKAGTTVEWVVRAAHQSVMVCQDAALKSILCAIDGSTKSKKTLQTAIDFAHDVSVPLCIVHALPGYHPRFGMTKSQIKKKEAKLKNDAIDKMSQFLACIDFKNVKHDIIFHWGEPANVILDYAEDGEFDLIVVGATGQSMLKHVLLGSTAEKVLRHADASLLVVR